MTATFLTFHGIGVPGPNVPPAEAPYWLPVEAFEVIAKLVAGERDAVRITFDDGNESDLRLAAPILRKAGLTAQFFIVADRINAPGYLAAEDIRALRSEGMEIGSHGAAHVAFTSLGAEVLKEQLLDSFRSLGEIVGEPVRALAVPFGAYDRAVLRVARACGASRVFTSDGGEAAPDAWVSPRNTVRRDTAMTRVAEMVKGEFPALLRAKSTIRRWQHALA